MRIDFVIKYLFVCVLLVATNIQAKEPRLNHGMPYDNNNDYAISDYLASEKLDGIRAYWDGHKLLSKTGKPIHCPEWFTDKFPNKKLDGELWIKRQSFEQTISTVRKNIPIDQEWKKVKYMLFELPEAEGDFQARYQAMKILVQEAKIPHLKVIQQQRLANQEKLMTLLSQITAAGGEGIMLHLANSKWQPGRSNHILKVKEYYDAEAVILEHNIGKGKYSDMLGSILVKNNEGKIFKIGTGFSDEERKKPPKIGSIITYKYFGKTANGIPRFASFLRIHTDT
ncbi:MAG: DNA ligase [Desulfotalea sp.]